NGSKVSCAKKQGTLDKPAARRIQTIREFRGRGYFTDPTARPARQPTGHAGYAGFASNSHATVEGACHDILSGGPSRLALPHDAPLLAPDVPAARRRACARRLGARAWWPI